MKLAACAVVALLVTWSAGASNPTKESARRRIDGAVVDLTPLLKWQKSHRGERPLKGWVQIRGGVVGTNAYGWVVQAEVEGVAGKAKKVVLKDPPRDEAAAYEQLKFQLADLNRRRSRLEAEANRPLHERRVRTRRGVRVIRDPHRADVAEAKSELKVVDRQIKDVQKQLNQIPTSGGHLRVDCLALNTGTAIDGLPIYDRGIPVK